GSDVRTEPLDPNPPARIPRRVQRTRKGHLVRARSLILIVFVGMLAGLMPSIAHSQTLSPFQRGVPAGTATAGPVSLTLADAVRRALEHNLGVILTEQRVDEAGGARWRALSELLPNANARLAATRQQVNLKAFGFPLPAGFPSVVGPFNVYDARVYLTQSLIDLHAMNDARAEAHKVEAARFEVKDARDSVILVSANAYAQAIATSARVDAA